MVALLTLLHAFPFTSSPFGPVVAVRVHSYDHRWPIPQYVASPAQFVISPGEVIRTPPKKLGPVDITGYYMLEGREVGGKGYRGLCAVTRHQDAYLVQWLIEGGAPFSGIGIRDGDRLAVAWAMPSASGAITRGINYYRLEGDKLVGRWTVMPGPGLFRSETLTLLRRLPDTPADAELEEKE